jgi:hypothetical protein
MSFVRRLRPGRAALTAVAVFTGVVAYHADWNESHIHNPNWPPHAKFHNAQTMAMASESALLSVWLLWGRGGDPVLRLRAASAFASLYWASLLPSILFPGTAFWDPGDEERLPTIRGVRLNQGYGAVFFLAVIAAAYRAERRALGRR